MLVCFKCHNRFESVPPGVSQDDICASCLRICRVASGLLPPAEPPPIDPDLAPLRDFIERGPIPSWGFTSEDFERLRAKKLDAIRAHEDAPSDATLRDLRCAERGLRRLQDHNAARVAQGRPS